MSYETLSETHWNAPYIEPNFTPDLYINIDKEIEIKCRALNCYKSQIKNNSSRSIKAVKALAAFRGSQNACNFAEGYKVLESLHKSKIFFKKKKFVFAFFLFKSFLKKFLAD